MQSGQSGISPDITIPVGFRDSLIGYPSGLNIEVGYKEGHVLRLSKWAKFNVRYIY